MMTQTLTEKEKDELCELFFTLEESERISGTLATVKNKIHHFLSQLVAIFVPPKRIRAY